MTAISETEKQTFINLSLFMALTKPLIRKDLLSKQEIVNELQAITKAIPAFSDSINDVIKSINDMA